MLLLKYLLCAIGTAPGSEWIRRRTYVCWHQWKPDLAVQARLV